MYANTVSDRVAVCRHTIICMLLGDVLYECKVCGNFCTADELHTYVRAYVGNFILVSHNDLPYDTCTYLLICRVLCVCFVGWGALPSY